MPVSSPTLRRAGCPSTNQISKSWSFAVSSRRDSPSPMIPVARQGSKARREADVLFMAVGTPREDDDLPTSRTSRMWPKSASTSAVISSLPEMLLPDLLSVLKELRRILKPNGVLRLSVPDRDRRSRAYLRRESLLPLIPNEEAMSFGAKSVVHLVLKHSHFSHARLRRGASLQGRCWAGRPVRL
jgi:SAM-dependent methyltransferase